MKKILSILLIINTGLFLYSQDTGIAVEESPFSAKVNPALMGTENSSGAAWSGEIDSGDFTDSFSFIFSGKSLAYYYDSDEGEVSHNFALSIPGGPGFHMGTSLFFPEGSEKDLSWNLSLLMRPFNSLSLGMRTMDISSDDPYLLYGAGLRPFFFSPYMISRLTLFSDFEYKSSHEALSAGIRLEALDGLNIFTEYFFEKEIFEAGVSFSMNHFTAGVKGAVYPDLNTDKLKVYSYIPSKRERSIVKAPFEIIAEYDMGNIIRDFPEQNIFTSLFIGRGKAFTNSIYNFIKDMEDIAKTDEIKAVVFKNQMFLTSYANITEIADSLEMLKAKGKKIYFYFDNAGNNSYTLAASSADKIFLNPMGALNLRGYSKRSLYMKDFFSKFGVEFYNFRSHEFKTAYNNFTEDSMTDAEKEVFEKLYAEFSKKQESMIKLGRIGKLNGDIQDIIAGGPYLSSSEAEKMGLVDRLIYKDELKDIYSEMGYKPVKYSSLPEKKNYNWDSLFGKILPVIYASGDIVPGGGLKGSYIGSDSFVNAVRSARNNPKVKCIIIRINSGGGSAFSSDIIAREIALCREGNNPKPVIVSMGGVAASGGYYMAAPAEVIFTDEVSVTGSIGVIAMFPDLSGLLSKLGINYESINSSDGSDFGNPLRSMTEDEIKKIDDYIAENYKKFTDIVKKYRKLTDEEIDAAAQGRVWAGSDALRLKLADKIGGLKDAVSYAADKYYKGTEYRVTETVPGNNLFNFPFFMSGFNNGDIKIKTLMTDEIEEVLDFYKRIEQYNRGEALFLLPYSDKETGAVE